MRATPAATSSARPIAGSTAGQPRASAAWQLADRGRHQAASATTSSAGASRRRLSASSRWRSSSCWSGSCCATRRPLPGPFGAFAAAGLLAGDFLHVVQSRIGMLDVFVTIFVIAAVLFAVLDRDRPTAAGVVQPAGRLDPPCADAAPAVAAAGRHRAGRGSGRQVVRRLRGAGRDPADRRLGDRSPARGEPDMPPRSWPRATWLALREDGLPRSWCCWAWCRWPSTWPRTSGGCLASSSACHGRKARSGAASGTTSRRCSPSTPPCRAAIPTSRRHGHGCC